MRRAFLCGEDTFSGQSFEHRREWVVDRITWLCRTFAIEVASYAIMSNHYHLVLRVDVDKAKVWSESTIIQRWARIYATPEVIKQYLKNPKAAGIREVAQALIATWQSRLTDISWFMRCLNEYLARQANAEDNCKGRFWEGRFKSQPLLDEAAVLTAMSYVDLNPIRAKMAETPEQSDFTSIQQRLQQVLKTSPVNSIPLIKLSNSCHQTHKNSLAFSPHDYLQLVDWAGRAILPKKRGYIDENESPILKRLNLNADGFIKLMEKTDDLSKLTVVGSPSLLTHYKEKLRRKFIKGLYLNCQLFSD